MKVNLKPRPFCGGEAELVDYGVSGAYEVVQCSDCWVRTRIFDKSIKIGGAVDAWNRRKADSCERCKNNGLWENEYEYGVSCPCLRCARRAKDNYEPERRTE